MNAVEICGGGGGEELTMTVWFCTFCRDDVQVGAKPETCGPCNSGESLVPIQVPYVPAGVVGNQP